MKMFKIRRIKDGLFLTRGLYWNKTGRVFGNIGHVKLHLKAAREYWSDGGSIYSRKPDNYEVVELEYVEKEIIPMKDILETLK